MGRRRQESRTAAADRSGERRAVQNGCPAARLVRVGRKGIGSVQYVPACITCPRERESFRPCVRVQCMHAGAVRRRRSMQECVCGRARLVFLSDPRGGMHVRRPLLVRRHVRTTLITLLFGGRHALQITIYC